MWRGWENLKVSRGAEGVVGERVFEGRWRISLSLSFPRPITCPLKSSGWPVERAKDQSFEPLDRPAMAIPRSQPIRIVKLTMSSR